MPDGTAPAVAGTQPILLTLLNRLERAFVLDDRDAAGELLLAAKVLVAKETGLGQLQSIEQRIHDVRLRLFDSTAVIDVARRAISPDDDWYLHHALRLAIEKIDAACTALDLIASDAREVAQSNEPPILKQTGTE